MNLIWILLIMASWLWLNDRFGCSVNQVIVNVGRETLELALPLVAATCFGAESSISRAKWGC
ncbi:MAG: hypothetical protein ACLSA6_08515 [Holdemania massiliensis]